MMIVAISSLRLDVLNSTFPPTPKAVVEESSTEQDDAKCFVQTKRAFYLVLSIRDKYDDISALLKILTELQELSAPIMTCFEKDTQALQLGIDKKCIYDHFKDAKDEIANIINDVQKEDIEQLNEDIQELINTITDMRSCF